MTLPDPNAALDDERAALQGLWELSGDLLATANASGYLTRVNPSWEKTLGWSPAELTGRPYLEFVHPDDLDETLATAAALLVPGSAAVNFENRYATKDGGWRWLAWNARTSVDGLSIYCVARDVTRGREVTDQLHDELTRLTDRELMLSSVIENNQALIYVKDLDGRYLVYNQPFAAAFNLDTRGEAEGLTGLTVLLGRDDTWLDPELQPTWRANDLRAARGRISIEEWSDHPTLGRFTYDSLKFPLIDAAGVRYATCGVSLETTERVRLIEKHREAEELFRGAFEHSPIGMAMIGPDRLVMRANPALARITGYSIDDLIGRSLHEMTIADHLPDNAAELQRLVIGEVATYDRELQLRTASDDLVWVQASSSTVRKPDGALVYVIAQVQDITQRKRLEDRLRHTADHDSLTGLRNRRIFEEDLMTQVGRCQRYAETAALLMVDLDGFKAVNDGYGHRAGDEILRTIARALKRRLRTSDLVARLGGDEFAILLPYVDASQAQVVAAAVRECIAGATIQADGRTVGVTASVGVAMITEETKGADAVMVAADTAMYAVKPES